MELSSSTPPPCPHLPPAVLGRAEGSAPVRFVHHLGRAQAKWLERLPAQAILQLNKAFALDLPDQGPGAPGVDLPPWPWPALGWILSRRRHEAAFLGNPVRHFQHYASRVPPRAASREVRILRAWLAFHLAEALLPAEEFPRDETQIEAEKLELPRASAVLDALAAERPREAVAFAAAWRTCVGPPFPRH